MMNKRKVFTVVFILLLILISILVSSGDISKPKESAEIQRLRDIKAHCLIEDENSQRIALDVTDKRSQKCDFTLMGCNNYEFNP